MAKAKPLNEDHKRFVAEYLIDQNGTRAYLAAYPAAAYTTARNEAAKLLAKPCIKNEIRAGRDALQKRTHIRADTALREAARLAFSDPLHIFEADGSTPRNMRDIPIETRRAIAGVKTRRERTEKRPGQQSVTCPNCEHAHEIPCDVLTHYETVEYKLWPKTHGIDKVFKHLGLEQEITPLDALLAALPPALAAEVRAALAGDIQQGGGGAGAT